MTGGPLFLIWSIEHNAWWRPEWCGYTKQLAEAGRYHFTEAREICAQANIASFNECMVPAECVDLPEVS